MINLKRLGHFIVYLWNRINADHLFYVAAALTLTTLLAIVPVISIFIYIFNLLPIFKKFDLQINQFISSHLLPASDALVKGYLNKFFARDFSSEMLIYLFVVSLFALQTIESAFNHIWRVKKGRRGLFSFIIYWVILILAPLLIGISLFLTSLLGSLSFLSVHSLFFNQFFVKVVIALLEVVGLTILYAVIPNKKVPLRYALLGALSAMLILGLSKFFFVWYMQNFPIYAHIYGAIISSFPLLIIWIYIIWFIILIVAEVINLVSYKHNVEGRENLPPFIIAYLILFFLWEAKKEKQRIRLKDLLDNKFIVYEEEIQKILEELEQTGWIEQKTGSILVLKKEASQIKLIEMYQSLPWKLPTIDQIPKLSMACLMNLRRVIKEIDVECYASLQLNLVDCFGHKK